MQDWSRLATHCCLLAREEEGSDLVMHGSPLSSSWDLETEKPLLYWCFGYHWLPGGVPKETGDVPHSAEVPARSNGTLTGCGVFEMWETPLGKALTVILKSPLPFFVLFFLLYAASPRVLRRTPDRGRGRGTPPCLTSRSLLFYYSEMVLSPQEEHEPSMKASSACWMPRHVTILSAR